MKKIILKSFASIVFFFVSFILAGCDQVLDPTGLKPGEMSATSSVEGSYFATDATATVQGSNYLVKASMPSAAIGGDIVITLLVPKGTVPYTVAVGADATALIDYCLEESAGKCTTFKAEKGAGTGTIKITSISPYLEGTFNGTLVAVGAGTGARTITGGEFKANF